MSSALYRVVKRTADIVASAVLILATSPILVACAIVLKLTGEGEVLYLQERVGLDRRIFHVYKLVTMSRGSERHGTITAKNDPRVLPVGRVLRKAKLNELPQLFNVLFGHISLVGPRPLTQENFAMYPTGVQDLIYADNRPGVTGIGSVFFRAEDEFTAASDKPVEQSYIEDVMPVKGALELWYRTNKSFAVDLKLLLLTVWVVVVPRTRLHLKAFSSLPADVMHRYVYLLEQTRSARQ